jgi:hypothetical protein
MKEIGSEDVKNIDSKCLCRTSGAMETDPNEPGNKEYCKNSPVILSKKNLIILRSLKEEGEEEGERECRQKGEKE